jgi:type II secretory pathway component PulL
MISVKDRQLLQEALDWRCDAFMTMERRLPTAAAFIERQTGLRVMRQTTYWDLLSHFARLYY